MPPPASIGTIESILASVEHPGSPGPSKENRATDTCVELQDWEKVCVVVSQHVASAQCQAGTSAIAGLEYAEKSPVTEMVSWLHHDSQLNQNSEPPQGCLAILGPLQGLQAGLQNKSSHSLVRPETAQCGNL